jgi:hypothetical protein
MNEETTKMRALIEYIISPENAAEALRKEPPPAKFYLIDAYNNYVFMETDNIWAARTHSAVFYKNAEVKSSLLAHKAT